MPRSDQRAGQHVAADRPQMPVHAGARQRREAHAAKPAAGSDIVADVLLLDAGGPEGTHSVAVMS